MTSQPSEPSAPIAPVRSAGNGHADQAVQAILLKRQIAELERRLEAITQSERKTRADLLEALGASQASAKEQAKLHEDLAERERVVAEVVSREADLQAQLSGARAKTHETAAALATSMADLASARTIAARLPASEAAAAAARTRTTDLVVHVEQRSRILGFLAEQMRQERRRLLALSARLYSDGLTAKDSARAALDAALGLRLAAIASDQKLHSERWQSWKSTSLPPHGAPRRRNRPAKLMEKILCRLGPIGAAVAINGSGLWNSEFQVDNRPASRRATLISYAASRASPETTVKALFDQAFYLASNPAVAGARLPPLAHYLIHGDRENRRPHPLVDVAWYRANNAHELGSTGLTVLQHFLFIGAAKGLNPHPLFDVKHYVGQLSDPTDQSMNPLVHYLRTGWRRGFNPHPLFDNDFYLKRYPDVADLMIPPLLHYVTVGAREGRDPHPLFFGQWYQATYPDVLTSGQLPLAHFLDRGLTERRRPNPYFDTAHYLQTAPEAYSTGIDPLRHYVTAGAWKGLSPNRDFDTFAFLAANPRVLNNPATPLESWIEAERPQPTPGAGAQPVDAAPHRATLLLMFDPAFYAEQAGDLLSPADDPLDHYLTTGWRLGLNPHRLFDTAWYAARYPDAAASSLSPLLHFVMTGAAELRDPHPLFDSCWYAEYYPDVIENGEIPLVHYIHFGALEGRSPGPLFDAAAYLRAYPDVRGHNPLVHFLTRWPFDNRPHGFDSASAESPHGANSADWVAGLAEALVQVTRAARAGPN